MRVPTVIACVLALCVACTPRLLSKTIVAHPPLNLSVPKPTLEEASEKTQPPWLTRTDAEAIVGQGAGRTLDEARDVALRDMARAASSFVSTDVSSSFEAEQSENTKDGHTEERAEVHSEVRANRQKLFADLHAEDTYWERIMLPSGTEEFRVYVRTHLSPADIARARIGRMLEAMRGGRRTVAILPFEAKAEDTKLARAIAGEVARRLLENPALAVADAEAVGSLIPKDALFLPAAERALLVERAVEPDAVVIGEIVRQSQRLVVNVRVRLRGARALERSLSGDDLFDLEEQLVGRLSSDLAEGAGR